MLRGCDLDKILADDSAGTEDPVLDEDPQPAQVEQPVKVATEVNTKVATQDTQEGKPESETPLIFHDGGVEMLYVKRASHHASRLSDGCTMGFRMQQGEPLTEEIFGGPNLPWALEVVARRGVAIGEVVEVIGRGEYAFADCEELVKGEERRWRFELVTVGTEGWDKFRMTTHERIEKASELRERGNTMMKKGRLLRAGDHYERGSNLMDVIEAEDLPGQAATKDQKAVEANRRIRTCQQPLLLNWALVLIKQGKFHEAERKCTEVLLDIDKSCVKALFRRGQCHTELGNLEEARADLRRAQELDQSVSAEVERELIKLERAQKKLDAKDKRWAQKALQGALGDSRSSAPAPAPAAPAAPKPAALADDENEGLDVRVKESSATRVNAGSAGDAPAGRDLMATLQAQERKADKDDVDELTWCRQREAIYNQFIQQPQKQDD